MQRRIIAIEGVDAAGKTTLAKGLPQNHKAIYYKTPGTKTPEQRRKFDQVGVSVTERFHFYLEACREDIAQILEIAKNGTDVICDRLVTSTSVHHQSMDEQLDVSEAEALDKEIPKVQILLKATRNTIITRLSQRGNLSRFEQDANLFVKTQNRFLLRRNDLIISTDECNVEQALRAASSFLYA